MYFTSFPDHSRADFDERLHFSRFGKANIIFNAQSSNAGCNDHVGCLSIKTVLNGEEWYGINGRKVAVRPGQFLVLNNGQSYSCRIAGGTVRSASVFFAHDFAKAVLRDSLQSEQDLIDNPFHDGDSAPEFYQRLHGFEGNISQNLLGLIHSLQENGYDSDRVDEQLSALLGDLIRIHRNDVAASKNLHALKSSTQKEIFKRVCIARDMIQTAYREEVSLKLLGKVSCLSTPQLIRQFKAAFGITPHRYLANVRLQNAAALLRSTDKTVFDIAMACGFENTGSFCRAFKTAFGRNAMSLR